MNNTFTSLEFAKRLKNERKNNNLTQKNVAELIGMSVRQYRKYEKGLIQPKLQFIAKLKKINFDIDYLIIGLSETDIYIKSGLERMPNELYDKTISELTETFNKHKQNKEDMSYSIILDKIIKYGKSHINHKTIREVPTIRFFSDIKEFN